MSHPKSRSENSLTSSGRCLLCPVCRFLALPATSLLGSSIVVTGHTFIIRSITTSGLAAHRHLLCEAFNFRLHESSTAELNLLIKRQGQQGSRRVFRYRILRWAEENVQIQEVLESLDMTGQAGLPGVKQGRVLAALRTPSVVFDCEPTAYSTRRFKSVPRCSRKDSLRRVSSGDG